LVWIETPTNPTLKVIDIAKVAEAVHGFSKDIIVAVDNTFLTSFYQVRSLNVMYLNQNL
jgi:cystathionine beta-lyase/cystathionine gamma-synthase